jgi:hypothetical protein
MRSYIGNSISYRIPLLCRIITRVWYYFSHVTFQLLMPRIYESCVYLKAETSLFDPLRFPKIRKYSCEIIMSFIVCVVVYVCCCKLLNQLRDFRKIIYVSSCFIQGDQKVSVHMMIRIQKVTNNVQSVSRQSPDIYWYAELCSGRPCSVWTRLTLTRSVIMVSDWNCLKYFCVFCDL